MQQTTIDFEALAPRPVPMVSGTPRALMAGPAGARHWVLAIRHGSARPGRRWDEWAEQFFGPSAIRIECPAAHITCGARVRLKPGDRVWAYQISSRLRGFSATLIGVAEVDGLANDEDETWLVPIVRFDLPVDGAVMHELQPELADPGIEDEMLLPIDAAGRQHLMDHFLPRQRVCAAPAALPRA